MRFVLTLSVKLILQSSIADFICLSLHHIKEASYAVLIVSLCIQEEHQRCLVINRLSDIPAPGTVA